MDPKNIGLIFAISGSLLAVLFVLWLAYRGGRGIGYAVGWDDGSIAAKKESDQREQAIRDEHKRFVDDLVEAGESGRKVSYDHGFSVGQRAGRPKRDCRTGRYEKRQRPRVPHPGMPPSDAPIGERATPPCTQPPEVVKPDNNVGRWRALSHSKTGKHEAIYADGLDRGMCNAFSDGVLKFNNQHDANLWCLANSSRHYTWVPVLF